MAGFWARFCLNRKMLPMAAILAKFSFLFHAPRLQLQAKLRSGKDQLSAAAAAHRLGIPAAWTTRVGFSFFISLFRLRILRG